MLEDLEELAVDKPKRLGPFVLGLDQNEVQMHIAKIRASLPSEVKQAANLTRESERLVEQAREDAAKTVEKSKIEAEKIVGEARVEADRIREQARLELEQLLDENEVLRVAKAQADEMRNQAEADATATRRGADDYAYQVLNHIEGVLSRAMSVIDRSKADLKPSNDLAVVPGKEKIKAV